MGLHQPAEVLSGDIDFCVAYTLVDITDTGESNPKGMSLAYKQAQNLNTLIQTLSLRTQLVLGGVTLLPNEDLSQYKFGSDYSGIHHVWMYKFASEKPGVWDRAASSMFYAFKDCNLTPIHTDLNESVALTNTFVTTNNKNKNLYFINYKSL